MILHMSTATVYPSFVNLEMNIGEGALQPIIAECTGMDIKKIKLLFKDIGDYGEIIKTYKIQKTFNFLSAANITQLTIHDVYNLCTKLCVITGTKSNVEKRKIILEVNPSDIVAGCQYVGMFEDNMTKLMKLCEKLDVIVFIDEIHTIYGIGLTKDKNNDMASMLKHYIDRSNLKVIGTTTEKEYQEFFSDDALKRRFEKITVKEPTEDILYQIVDKVIGDYYVKNGISFENENIRNGIVNIILSATEKSHRVYNDMVNNPDLAISIVDKAFAFAKVYDSEFITAEHFIEGFEYCDRIYESTREQAIARLRSLDTSISKPVQRVLKIDFNRFRK